MEDTADTRALGWNSYGTVHASNLSKDRFEQNSGQSTGGYDQSKNTYNTPPTLSDITESHHTPSDHQNKLHEIQHAQFLQSHTSNPRSSSPAPSTTTLSSTSTVSTNDGSGIYDHVSSLLTRGHNPPVADVNEDTDDDVHTTDEESNAGSAVDHISSLLSRGRQFGEQGHKEEEEEDDDDDLHNIIANDLAKDYDNLRVAALQPPAVRVEDANAFDDESEEDDEENMHQMTRDEVYLNPPDIRPINYNDPFEITSQKELAVDDSPSHPKQNSYPQILNDDSDGGNNTSISSRQSDQNLQPIVPNEEKKNENIETFEFEMMDENYEVQDEDPNLGLYHSPTTPDIRNENTIPSEVMNDTAILNNSESIQDVTTPETDTNPFDSIQENDVAVAIVEDNQISNDLNNVYADRNPPTTTIFDEFGVQENDEDIKIGATAVLLTEAAEESEIEKMNLRTFQNRVSISSSREDDDELYMSTLTKGASGFHQSESEALIPLVEDKAGEDAVPPNINHRLSDACVEEISIMPSDSDGSTKKQDNIIDRGIDFYDEESNIPQQQQSVTWEIKEESVTKKSRKRDSTESIDTFPSLTEEQALEEEASSLDKKVCGGRCFCTRRRTLIMIAMLIIVAVVLGVVFGTRDKEEETATPSPTQPPQPTPQPKPTVDIKPLSWPDVGGTSVSISDNALSFAVGGDGTSDNFRIFAVNTTDDQQMDIHLFDNTQSHALFATSLVLSGDGDRVAIASLDATDNQTHVIEVYDKSKPLGNSILISPPNNSSTHHEKLSLSFSENGSVIAIGYPSNEHDGPEKGHVYVYQYNPNTETWTLRGLVLEGGSPGDGFGKSVSLSANGEIVAVGAYLSSINGEKSGSVAIYQYSSTGWENIGEEIYGDNEMEKSGYSVSLSDEGDIIAIGSPHASSSDNTENIGQVRIYFFNKTEKQWVKHGSTIPGEVENGMLGSTVSISGNGMYVAMSSKQQNTGLVHIYNYENDTDWVLYAKYEGNSSEFGYSLSLNDDGKFLVVGAPDEQNGTVYYYATSGQAEQ